MGIIAGEKPSGKQSFREESYQVNSSLNLYVLKTYFEREKTKHW